MNDFNEKYKNIPIELKRMKRWICFKVEGLENGRKTKRPYNALNGSLAKVNDSITWTTFELSLSGCEKYGFDGIGFVLGNGIFGIDLDNHEDENNNLQMSEEEFKELSKEFIENLNSYTELSLSGRGIHIICEGKLPQGRRRHGCIEMYDSNRFFAFTGNAINNISIQNREKEIIPLYEKYVNINDGFSQNEYRRENQESALKLSDNEIIEIALRSKNGERFYKYYHDGDISINNGNHSEADMAFCNMLAFWCNGNKEQMDRIFRNSALMREKWDEYRGTDTIGNKITYGEITINEACNRMTNGFVKNSMTKNFTIVNSPKPIFDSNGVVVGYNANMNLDENGEPIFKIKKIFKSYSYDDTGNALRFYDYFGDLFKYNTTDKIFMFWTGKTWIRDVKDIIRKYANKFIEILKEEENSIKEKRDKYLEEGMKDKANEMEAVLRACQKNSSRVANKAGKDAMINEFKALYDIPVENSEFDKDDYLLNTESGIVDLQTGEIMPFDKEKMMSKNTHSKVSFEEPQVWLKFIRSVFQTGDEEKTQELIDSIQTCLGYSISGSVREQCLFIAYGDGSNGKSTLIETINKVVGDYGDTAKTDLLIQNKFSNNSTFSLAKLQNTRFVAASETDEGGLLQEASIKQMTGGEQIIASFKFANEFSYYPKFKIWLSTNNRPIIRGKDYGIWRRLFLFPFLVTIKEKDKDKFLLDKLEKEKDRILGWLIQGHIKYMQLGHLIKSSITEEATNDYKNKMDIVSQFVIKECKIGEEYSVNCKLLYNAYKEWARDNSEFQLKESKFSEQLKQKGIEIKEDSNGKDVYIGIKIKGSFTIKEGI